jgi:hypothetical protein
MLPVFPKAKGQMRRVFFDEVFRSTWSAHPILKEIRTRPQTEGREAFYQREDGRLVETEYKRRSVERSWSFEDARGLDPEAFLEAAASIGSELGNQMMADLIAGVSSATEEVGNVVKCGREGLTFEQFLELHRKVAIEFDDAGVPYKKAFLAGEAASAALNRKIQEWSSDPKKCAALEAVMEEKRRAFDEREASRRMVD